MLVNNFLLYIFLINYVLFKIYVINVNTFLSSLFLQSYNYLLRS